VALTAVFDFALPTGKFWDSPSAHPGRKARPDVLQTVVQGRARASAGHSPAEAAPFPSRRDPFVP